MFLVDGIEKSSADGVVAVFLGVFADFAEAERVTIGFAAFGKVWEGFLVNIANEFIEAIFVFDNEFNVDFFGIDF